MSVFKGQCSHLLSVARLTFEKSKLPIIPFKGGVNMSRQAPPEVTNRHWVSVQDMIVANPPEPFFLKTKAAFLTTAAFQKRNSAWTRWRYLKHKHLPSEDGDGVKVSVADVGSEAGLVRRVGGLRVVVRWSRCDRRRLRSMSRAYETGGTMMIMISVGLKPPHSHHQNPLLCKATSN